MKKRILIISNIGCGPPYMGNRIRLRMLLKELRQAGLIIHFAGVNISDTEKQSTEPYIDRWITNFKSYQVNTNTGLSGRVVKKLRKLTFLKNILPAKTYPVDYKIEDGWLEDIAAIQKMEKYDRVLVSYIFNSKFLEAFSDSVVKIIDTHDKFSDRNKLLKKAGINDYWFSTSQEEEKKALFRANRIIAIQKEEEAFFTSLTGRRIPVLTVGHIAEVNKPDNKRLGTKTAGYFASSNSLNHKTLNWFNDNVASAVKKYIPDFRFIVGGSVCDRLSSNEGYELFGKVKDPATFYQQCALTVNPMKVGTGLKIKTVESLSYGCPVISSSAAAAGLNDYVGNGIFIANTKDEFISLLVKLYKNASDLEKASINGLQVIEKHNYQSRQNLRMALDI